MTPSVRARDPGQQPERTALAWTRTSVAVLVNAALLLRVGVEERQIHLVMAGGLMLAGAVGLRAIAMHRRRSTLGQGVAVAPSGWLMATTAGLVMVGALGAIAAVWH